MSATAGLDLTRLRLGLKIRAAAPQMKGGQPVVARADVLPHHQYAGRLLDWIVEKLAVPRETLIWSMNPGYRPGERCGCATCERLGYVGPHLWDGTEDPIAVIIDAISAGRRMVGVESGNGTGKSFVAACLILAFIAIYDGARAFTFAPKEDQLSLYIWAEISRLWPRFQVLFPTAKLTHLQILMHPEDKLWGAWGYAVGMRNGEEVSSKASGMHGAHMLLVTEETQGMDPRVIAANEATCTDPHNLRLALGNPNFPADELHRFCTSPGALHVRISAEDHPNVVTGRTLIPGATSRVKVEEAERKHTREGRLYQTRIRGLCPDGGGPALEELTRGVHLQTAKQIGLPPLDSGDVSIFGFLDWGHAHPWSFGKYACFFDRQLGRERVVKLETIGGHRMRPDRIAAAIKAEFPDVQDWDYLGAGSDIKQRHVGRTASNIPTPTVEEQLQAAGLVISAYIDDGPNSRAPRLNNFRDWIGWRERGPVDSTTLRATDGIPAFVFLDTPGNRACLEQCETMTTDPKKPEVPLKRDANPQTGEGGDDAFDETMNALATRPFAGEPGQEDVNENVHPGFERGAGGKKRRRRPKHASVHQEDDTGFGYDFDDDEEEGETWSFDV